MKKVFNIILLCSAALTLSVIALKAQKKSGSSAKKTSSGLKKLPGGLELKLIQHKAGSRKIALGDLVMFHAFVHIKDSILINSRKMNNNQPMEAQVTPPRNPGDVMEAFPFMSEGDSVVVYYSVDSAMKYKVQLPPFAKKGETVVYEISIVAARSQKEVKDESLKQEKTDDKLLQAYFAKNNLKPKKTPSGMYYSITKEGTGNKPKLKQTVYVNYTGKTLDGKTFDSNEDPAFHHTEPINFVLGNHQVIQGWDEGIGYIKKGGKGILYIPSTLAYGAQARTGIPANSILIFTVEVTDIK